MSYIEWKDKTAAFKQIDVRGIQGNFFQGIKRQAMQLTVGNGLEIVQSFDPISASSTIPSRRVTRNSMRISTA